MNEHDLLDAIGKTEEAVLEASEKRPIPWKTLLTAAACLLRLRVVGRKGGRERGGGMTEPPPALLAPRGLLPAPRRTELPLPAAAAAADENIRRRAGARGAGGRGRGGAGRGAR